MSPLEQAEEVLRHMEEAQTHDDAAKDGAVCVHCGDEILVDDDTDPPWACEACALEHALAISPALALEVQRLAAKLAKTMLERDGAETAHRTLQLAHRVSAHR